jgi:hypothetical protein
MSGLISQEKLNAKGQRDKETKQSPQIEEKDGGDEDGISRGHPLRAKQRSESFPDMVKDHRGGNEQAGIERQFDEGEKSLGNGKSNQIDLERSVSENTQQFFRKEENDDAADDDRNDDLKETFPQLIQRLKNLFSLYSCAKVFALRDHEANVTHKGEGEK